MENDWNVVVNFKGGKLSIVTLLSTLKRIEKYAQESGLPCTALRGLLEILVCKHIRNKAKSDPDLVNKCVAEVVKCLIPNEPIGEEELDILMLCLRLNCAYLKLEPSANFLAAWMYTALEHGVISKTLFSSNYYIPLIVLLKSSYVYENYLVVILTYIIVKLTSPRVINQVTSTLVLELYNNEVSSFFKNSFRLIIMEYQKHNFLMDVTFGQKKALKGELVLPDMICLFKHLPKMIGTEEVQCLYPGLPSPNYQGAALRQKLLCVATSEEMVSALMSNSLAVPKNPLSALATVPGQTYLVLLDANSPMMAQLFIDAKAALDGGNNVVASALAKLQEVAMYPFPPLADYWFQKVRTWNGNLNNDSGKIIVQCIPYLHFKSVADVKKMLYPLFCVFEDCSFIKMITILKALEQLHANMVTVIAGRRDPIPFTGKKPSWASKFIGVLETLAAEEEKFIVHFLKSHHGDAAKLMAIKFYLKVADAEEIKCISFTLPSLNVITELVATSNFVVLDELCALLNCYNNIVNKLQSRECIDEFNENLEILETITKETYRCIVWKSIKHTHLNEVLNINSQLVNQKLHLRHHPAFFVVFDELIKAEKYEEEELDYEMLLRMMVQFSPHCAKFLKCWDSMDW